MAMGQGATYLSKLPEHDKFVMKPEMFFQLTRPNVRPYPAVAAPGPGETATVPIRKAGIIERITVVFDGTLTIANAATATQDGYPYNLLKSLVLSANGTDIFKCNGEDLHALAFVRYPAYEDAVDVIGHAGKPGDGTNLTVGAHPVYLTWDIPVAVDDSTLIGALYAGSDSTNIEVELKQAEKSELVATAANLTVAGNFLVTVDAYDVPQLDDGTIVLPDLRFLHRFIAIPESFTVSPRRLEVPRHSGNLLRLFLSGDSAAEAALSALPSAAAANTIAKLEVEYGISERPIVYDPASLLLTKNNRDYGGVPPYERLVFDTVKRNADRDAIVIQALNEFAVNVELDDAVAITAGRMRLVYETLA